MSFVFMWFTPIKSLRVNSHGASFGIAIYFLVVTCIIIGVFVCLQRPKQRKLCENKCYYGTCLMFWGTVAIVISVYGLLLLFTYAGSKDANGVFRQISGVLLIIAGPSGWLVSWCGSMCADMKCCKKLPCYDC